VAATPTPISAATEQQHHDNNNQDQFHRNSPLTPTSVRRALKHQRRLQAIVPDKPVNLAQPASRCEQFLSGFIVLQHRRLGGRAEACSGGDPWWRRLEENASAVIPDRRLNWAGQLALGSSPQPASCWLCRWLPAEVVRATKERKHGYVQ
jgi:hypothetical protein